MTARANPDSGPPQVRSLARQFNHMASRLAELVDAQSRFVADASHQLRSPLTALRLRLENLQVDATGPSAEGGSRRRRRGTATVPAGGRPAHLEPRRPRRNRIARPSTSKRSSRIAATPGRPWPTSGVSNWKPHANRAGHTAALLVPGDLEQILDNLLANALDASPEGGRIRVTMENRRPGRLEVHVVDEGPGMSEEDRRRAFDRFWQGPDSQGGHSGLGLAIVRQLASRNDASVELCPAQPTGLDAVIRMAASHSPESKDARRSHQEQSADRESVRQ